MNTLQDQISERRKQGQPVWNFQELLEFIRMNDTTFREFGYFPGLTGGVLIKGSSNHNGDVMLMPLNDGTEHRLCELVELMEKTLGPFDQQVPEYGVRNISTVLLCFHQVALDFFITEN